MRQRIRSSELLWIFIAFQVIPCSKPTRLTACGNRQEGGEQSGQGLHRTLFFIALICCITGFLPGTD